MIFRHRPPTPPACWISCSLPLKPPRDRPHPRAPSHIWKFFSGEEVWRWGQREPHLGERVTQGYDIDRSTVCRWLPEMTHMPRGHIFHSTLLPVNRLRVESSEPWPPPTLLEWRALMAAPPVSAAPIYDTSSAIIGQSLPINDTVAVLWYMKGTVLLEVTGGSVPVRFTWSQHLFLLLWRHWSKKSVGRGSPKF